MEVNWNTKFINPINLIDISRGDKEKMYRYLVQFQELIPQRIENLKDKLAEGDRIQVRQILHNMSPQLQFFGIPDVLIPIQRLELEYQVISLNELESIVKNILIKLEGATEEINRIIRDHFEK